jgi:FkbM family methyltransferase
MSFLTFIQSTARRFGYDISGYPPISEATKRRRLFFEQMNFDSVIDVGANQGQFAEYIRTQIQFKRKIFSFEPLSSAYAVLRAKASKDPNWITNNFALGAIESKQEINISGNSFSSSLLNMLPSHIKSAPTSKYIDKEWVDIKTLDSIFDVTTQLGRNNYLKIDTQGFEKQVLIGAKNSIHLFSAIQLEISLVPLYEENQFLKKFIFF